MARMIDRFLARILGSAMARMKARFLDKTKAKSITF
jgi:hypothetical protein